MHKLRFFSRFAVGFISVVAIIYSVNIIISQSFDKQKKLFFVSDNYGHKSAADIDKDLKCLANNIYWEAGSEPFEGKVAVAQVTLNRAKNSNFPNDICKVVYQKNVVYNKVICQFSWYCNSPKKVVPVHQNQFEESEIVARKVLLEGFKLEVLTDALYYHADYVDPKWNKHRITKIGHHIFYR